MKIRVTFKDPDGPYECLQDAAKESLASTPGLSEEEREALLESRVADLRKLTGRWFEYGEYVTIEIDTDAKTATVVPVK